MDATIRRIMTDEARHSLELYARTGLGGAWTKAADRLRVLGIATEGNTVGELIEATK